MTDEEKKILKASWLLCKTTEAVFNAAEALHGALEDALHATDEDLEQLAEEMYHQKGQHGRTRSNRIEYI